MNELDALYWENRYKTQQTGWDIGYVAPVFSEYFENIDNKNLKILIAGGGNAHEMSYLFNKGFKNVYLIDWASSAIENIKKRSPDIPENQLICGNFFDHEQTYDLILEQTFFCALTPNLRPNYVQKMQQLLNTNGKLVGVLFNQYFEKPGPPFGGIKSEYETLFSPFFTLKKLENCYNSIAPRKDTELFFIFEKKNNEA